MGRPTIKDGLDQFQSWLRDSEKKTMHTSRNYTTYVRKILSNIGQDAADQTALNHYFDTQSDSKFVNMARSAWKAYVRYVKSTTGQQIATPSDTNTVVVPEITEPSELPYPVRQALNQLMLCNFTAVDISALVWIHVIWGDIIMVKNVPLVAVKHPTTGSYFRVPVSALKDLLEYAKPGTHHGTPLIPMRVGTKLRCSPAYLLSQGLIKEQSVEDMAQEALNALTRNETKKVEELQELEQQELQEQLEIDRLLSGGE